MLLQNFRSTCHTLSKFTQIYASPTPYKSFLYNERLHPMLLSQHSKIPQKMLGRSLKGAPSILGDTAKYNVNKL